MKALLSAVWPFWQSCRVLTFRAGVPDVPSKFGFDFITLLMLSASLGTARWALFNQGNTPLMMLTVFALQGLLPVLFVPVRSISIMALCFLGTSVVAIALNLAGLDANSGFLYYALLVWCMVAYIAGIRPLTPSKPAR